MASLGDQLLQPEDGWKRYDDTDNLIQYSNGCIFKNMTQYYNKTRHDFPVNNGCKFNFIGTKLRIISCLYTDVSSRILIKIDGSEEEFSTQNSIMNFQLLVYEKNDLDNRIHEVEIINLDSQYSFVFDAFDIDADGMLVPELSKDYEFPVKVGDEIDVADFAESLIGGEEQLLITREGGLYLTDGNGGYSQLNKDADLSNVYTKKEVDDLIANVEATDPNSHSHENSKVLNSLGDSAGMLSYNGKVVVNNNEYSFRSLPRAKVVENYSTSKGGKLPWLS